MKMRAMFLSALVALLLVAPGCDSKQEKVRNQMIDLMGDYADVLDGIKSNTDFVDAKPKLERIGAQMKDLANQVKALPKPTADEAKQLDKEFDAKSKAVGERISKNMERLAKLGVSPLEIMGAMHINPMEMPH